jgi:hypothetical protein
MSIPHFSALSNKRKQIFLDHPGDFECQEKIDGSNLKFKLDETFPWAMRKTVNGVVYKSPDDWGTDFWVTGFRAAHTALISMRHLLVKPYMMTSPYNGGEILDMELLFADSPNTIIYSKTVNNLVVFAPNPDNAFIASASISIDDVPFTTDGFTIRRETRNYEFNIRSLDQYSMPQSVQIVKVLEQARQMPLDEVGDFLVARIASDTSSFSGSDLTYPARIEGLVFKHVRDGWMFKLVDKLWFTAQNTKNYEVRHWLFKSPRRHKNSVMDSFWIQIENGHTVDSAASYALKRLDDKWSFYHPAMQDTQEPHIHLRNLEAFASIRYQLQEYAKNGLPKD